MKKVARDIQHYVPLIGIFLAGLYGFYLFSYDKVFRGVVAIAMAVAYVFWGLVHHHIHKDLYFSVVIEYVAFAVLGLIIIFSLLF